MTARAVKTDLKDIEALRALFLQESNHQIRYNACHGRGWTDSYLFTRDDVRIGYGSVKGQETADEGYHLRVLRDSVVPGPVEPTLP